MTTKRPCVERVNNTTDAEVTICFNDGRHVNVYSRTIARVKMYEPLAGSVVIKGAPWQRAEREGTLIVITGAKVEPVTTIHNAGRFPVIFTLHRSHYELQPGERRVHHTAELDARLELTFSVPSGYNSDYGRNIEASLPVPHHGTYPQVEIFPPPAGAQHSPIPANQVIHINFDDILC